MKNIVLISLLVLLFVIVILYPFKVKMSFHFDVFELVGFVSIKAYVFKLFSGKLIFEDGHFELFRGEKKQKKKKPMPLLSEYFISLSKKLSVEKFEWYFTCGSDSDARFVSLVCAYVLSLDAMLSSVLLNRYKHVEIFNDIDPIFDKDDLQVSSRSVVSFSFFDVFLSLFVAYKNYFKMMKRNKNVEQSNQ